VPSTWQAIGTDKIKKVFTTLCSEGVGYSVLPLKTFNVITQFFVVTPKEPGQLLQLLAAIPVTGTLA